MTQFILIILPLLLLTACSNNLQVRVLDSDTRYFFIEGNQEILSFNPPMGEWNQLSNIEQQEREISVNKLILSGLSPFQGVGYQARLGIQNMKSYEEKKNRLLNTLSTGNFLSSVNDRISQLYTEELRREAGYLNIRGSVTDIGGYLCSKIDLAQSYGPSPNNKKWGDGHMEIYKTFISCPLIIENDVWELFAFYSISIPTNKFKKLYGEHPPKIEEIRQDLESQLQPMLNSVFVYRNPSQKYPNDDVLAD